MQDPSPIDHAFASLKWLRFLAPVLLGILVVMVYYLNKQVGYFPPFSLVVVLGVVLAPLAELYYLWQRPSHFRYPILMSLSLLAFHAAFGLQHLSMQQGIAQQVLLGGLTVETLIGMGLGISSLLVIVAYGLRTWHKRPRRGIDLLKIVLVVILFGVPSVGWLSPQVFGISPTFLSRMEGIILVLASAGGFLLVHLIDATVLPTPEPRPYEKLIDEIQAKGEKS